MAEEANPPDVVDRALQILKATTGAEQLPSEVLQATQRLIAERQIAKRVKSATTGERIPWFQLAACVAFMVTTGLLAGCHQHLFAREAGREIQPNGRVIVFYSDGSTSAFNQNGLKGERP